MVTPPNWCQDAVPTTRGWIDPTTGELLKSQRMTLGEIEDYLGQRTGPVVTEQVVHEEPQMLHEAPVGNKSLEDMTKAELLALGEQTGVQVSKWDSKSVLIEKLL
jgi:hypothetical protein